LEILLRVQQGMTFHFWTITFIVSSIFDTLLKYIFMAHTPGFNQPTCGRDPN